jgi:hypothetical protein
MDRAYWMRPATRALADDLGVIPIGYRVLQTLQGRRWGQSGRKDEDSA